MGFSHKRTKIAANDVWLQVEDVGIAGNPALRIEARSKGRVLAWVEVEGLTGDVYLTFSVQTTTDNIKTVTSPEEMSRALLFAAAEQREVTEGLELLAEGWLTEVQTWLRDNPGRVPAGWPLGKPQ